MCEELNDLRKDMRALEDLEEGPLGKINFGGLKNEIKRIEDYFVLA